ncbi:MAG: hypothetical protein ACOYM2_00200 [Rectinemataceae bacterium]
MENRPVPAGIPLASLFMALNIAGTVILRSWGHTRDVMVANIGALCCTPWRR